MMADELRIRYTGTAGAYEDDGKTFTKNGAGVAVSDEQAEKLLALEGEHSFEEISEKEYAKIESDAKAAEAAEEGANTIAKKNEAEAKLRGAYYTAESQDEIDEIFEDEADDEADDEDVAVPSDEKAPEGGPVAPDAKTEADKVKKAFTLPAPSKSS